MTTHCHISCPVCRKPVEVEVTGPVTCASCQSDFEVGVYSPPLEEGNCHPLYRDGTVTVGRVSLTTPKRRYSGREIVGVTLNKPPRLGNGLNVSTVLGLVSAGFFASHQVLWGAASLGLALAVLLHGLRRPQGYLVSWLTRDGNEGSHAVGDLRTANHLVDLIRTIMVR